jgi:hypothetical protein
MSQAFEQGLELRSAQAGADLSAKQFYGVKIHTDGTAILNAAAGEFCYGVLQNTPTSGQQASIAIRGITRAKAGGVINAGATVAVTAAGKFVDAAEAVVDTQAGSATDAVIGSFVVGIHRGDAATADGDLFPLELMPMGAIPTTAA